MIFRSRPSAVISSRGSQLVQRYVFLGADKLRVSTVVATWLGRFSRPSRSGSVPLPERTRTTKSAAHTEVVASFFQENPSGPATASLPSWITALEPRSSRIVSLRPSFQAYSNQRLARASFASDIGCLQSEFFNFSIFSTT